MHDYPSDFYGKELRVVVLGYVRPEYNYASMGARPAFMGGEVAGETDPFSADALIKDINHDKVVALKSVSSDRPEYARFQTDAFFSKPTDLEPLPAGHDPSRPREKPAQ